MPLIGFKKQFAPMVEARTKRQTIRAKRKDGKNPHPGETLYLYVGLRTAYSRKLGDTVCKSVEEICIDQHGINIAGQWLLPHEVEALAKADGFDFFSDMLEFFRKTHCELPFYGLLIKW